MAFTHSVISHSFSNADGTPSSGAVEFSLSGRMTQPTDTIMPGSITCTLGAGGEFSQSLASNEDPTTIPQDTQWRVDIRIMGASEETFFIVVPSGGQPYDLGALLPQSPIGG